MGTGADQDSVLELLRELGPLEFKDMRVRLCIASGARLEAAVMVLASEGQIEPCGTPTCRAYRLRGDTRAFEVRPSRRRFSGRVTA